MVIVGFSSNRSAKPPDERSIGVLCMQHDVMGGGDRDGVRFGGNARYTLFLQTGLFHLYMHGVYLILQKLQLWLQLKIQLAHRPRFLRTGLSFHIISHRRLVSPIIFRSSIQN